MKVTILGCGTSGGVPRIGNIWGVCDPKNPKNRRRRVSILVDEGEGRLLVDTSPDLREISGPFEVGGIKVTPFIQYHGPITSLGFRFGKVAYSTDLNGLPDASWEILEGVDTWIVDALRPQPHPTHPHLEMTLGWIERLKPKRAILTHMTWDMDYDSLLKELPKGVEPGYDGLVIEL